MAPAPRRRAGPSTGAVKSAIQFDPCDNAADDKVSGKIFDRSIPENDATHVDGWLKDIGKPTSKSDICQAGVAAEVVNVGGQYHYVLYEFIQREPSGTGDLSSFVHLEGGAPGRDGDVLVEFDYDPGMSGSTGVAFYDWTSTGAGTTNGNPGWALRATPNLSF